MLRKHNDPARSGLHVQPGVVLPFHDEKSYEKWHLRKVELVQGGTRATATIESIAEKSDCVAGDARPCAARVRTFS